MRFLTEEQLDRRGVRERGGRALRQVYTEEQVRPPTERIMQALAVVGHAVHGDELCSDREPGRIGGAVPQYVGQLAFPAHDKAERKREIGELAPGLDLLEGIRWSLGIHQSVAAACDAVERGL